MVLIFRHAGVSQNTIFLKTMLCRVFADYVTFADICLVPEMVLLTI